MHHNAAAAAASALVSSSSTLAFIARALSSRASEWAGSGGWMDANAISDEKTAKQQHSALAIMISGGFP